MLSPSTETSISGTSPHLPICLIVSQYVYWRMTWRDVNSCYCDWRDQSVVWVGREVVLKNLCNGDILCPYDVSSYLAVVRFPYDFIPFGPCPKHGCFKIVG